MESKILLNEEPAYKKLQAYLANNEDKLNIQKLLKENPQRFESYR